jgi:hypothetical protein
LYVQEKHRKEWKDIKEKMKKELHVQQYFISMKQIKQKIFFVLYQTTKEYEATMKIL